MNAHAAVAPGDVPTLTGAQVVLRQIAPPDAGALRAIHAAPAVSAWWGPVGDGFPFGDDDAATRLAILHGGAVVGLVQFGEEPEPEYRHAWIDIFLDPARHGLGLGTDALRTLVGYLQRDRGHHRITIDPALDNLAAIRCYEKAGFRRVGVMQRAWRDPGTGIWRDCLLMELVTPLADEER